MRIWLGLWYFNSSSDFSDEFGVLTVAFYVHRADTKIASSDTAASTTSDSISPKKNSTSCLRPYASD
jgi:hypothetical protein